MFEYLSFEKTSFIARMNKTIKLDFSEGQLFYQYTDPVNGEKEGICKEDSDEIVTKIEEMHIENWKTEYKSKDEILDGFGWHLRYKQVGKRTKTINGDNAYPTDFDNLVNLLYKIVGINDRK